MEVEERKDIGEETRYGGENQKVEVLKVSKNEKTV